MTTRLSLVFYIMGANCIQPSNLFDVALFECVLKRFQIIAWKRRKKEKQANISSDVWSYL